MSRSAACWRRRGPPPPRRKRRTGWGGPAAWRRAAPVPPGRALHRRAPPATAAVCRAAGRPPPGRPLHELRGRGPAFEEADEEPSDLLVDRGEGLAEAHAENAVEPLQ